MPRHPKLMVSQEARYLMLGLSQSPAAGVSQGQHKATIHSKIVKRPLLFRSTSLPTSLLATSLVLQLTQDPHEARTCRQT